MTREEAIVHIKDVICENNTIKPNMVVFEQEKQALCMAIKALEQQPCEDVVSREVVRDMFCEIHCHNERSKCVFRNICKYMNHVSALPPVTPKPKTGKWIQRHIIGGRNIEMIVCSECGEEFSYDAETGVSEYNFCPNCGAKMEGESE